MDKNQVISDKMLCFLYNEMTEDESVDFLASLQENTSTMQAFLEIQETIDSIQPILYSPSEKLLSKVHAYASFNLIGPQ
jgi:hypothetical protein